MKNKPTIQRGVALSQKGLRKPQPLSQNRPFQEHPKTYEDLKQNKFEQTYIRGQITSAWGDSTHMYTREMKILVDEINNTVWNQTLKFIWMNLHFIYRGKRRKNLFANGPWLERAYGFFMREMVGSPLSFYTRSGWFFKIASYIDDLYPDFLQNDPFKNPAYYKFPYKVATIDYLYFVYQMPHRLELLKVAERENMNYDQFVDYVINYVLTENEGDPRKIQYKIMRLDAPTDAPYIGYSSYRPLRVRYMKTPERWRNKKHG